MDVGLERAAGCGLGTHVDYTEARKATALVHSGRCPPHVAEQLLPPVYEALRKLAAQRLAQEKPGQTLRATALVHEAYLRLVGAHRVQRWDGRGQFFAAAAEAMRRILLNGANPDSILLGKSLQSHLRGANLTRWPRSRGLGGGPSGKDRLRLDVKGI